MYNAEKANMREICKRLELICERWGWVSERLDL